jgi:hypothetical protein
MTAVWPNPANAATTLPNGGRCSPVDAIPQLERRLTAAGLSPDYEGVTRMPVLGYTAAIAVPAGIVAAVVAAAVRSTPGVLAVFAVWAAAVALAAAWARAAIVVAGDRWIAKHGLLRWRLLRLDRLRKVEDWQSKGFLYIRLWDTDGGYISLDVRTSVERIRPLMADWVGRFVAQGHAVSPKVTAALGLDGSSNA